MGDRLKAKQAEKFKHAQDAAFDDFSLPDLIRSARPDLLVEELGCRLLADAAGVERGTGLMLHDGVEGSGVRVVHGNRVVGVLDEKAAVRVRDVISKAGGILPCKVGRPPSVTDFFTVKITVEEGGGRRRK
jgi:hypothetical protein